MTSMLGKLLLTAAVVLAAIHGSAAQEIPCSRVRDAAIAACGNNVGCFIPQCNDDDSFKNPQNWASTGYWYCANPLSGFIFPETAWRPWEEVQPPFKCVYYWLTHQADCSEVQADATAACGGMVGCFIPQCNNDGTFDTTQYWGSTGYTYCANPVNGWIYQATAVPPTEPISWNCDAYWPDYPVLGELPPPCFIDIVLTLDVSSSIPRDQFLLARDFMMYFVDCPAFQEKAIRIAVINYTCEADTYFHLTPIAYGMSYHIEQLMRGDGGGETRTGHAIYHMMFTSKFGADAHHTAVILTDGYSDDDQQAAAADARNAGITLYAVCFGYTGLADCEALEDVTGSRYRVFPPYQDCVLAEKIVDDQCG
ncbi:uncharacterized protein LOC144866628 [Branchiostoma floridae x Branchiostoma japonicum]